MEHNRAQLANWSLTDAAEILRIYFQTKLILQNSSLDTHCKWEIAPRRMPQNFTNEQSAIFKISTPIIKSVIRLPYSFGYIISSQLCPVLYISLFPGLPFLLHSLHYLFLILHTFPFPGLPVPVPPDPWCHQPPSVLQPDLQPVSLERPAGHGHCSDVVLGHLASWCGLWAVLQVAVHASGVDGRSAWYAALYSAGTAQVLGGKVDTVKPV